MAASDAIFAKVRDVLRSEFELADEAIRLDAHLADDLDLDSLDAVALLTRLEEETGLVLPEEEVRSLATVRSVVDLVAAHTGRV